MHFLSTFRPLFFIEGLKQPLDNKISLNLQIQCHKVWFLYETEDIHLLIADHHHHSPVLLISLDGGFSRTELLNCRVKLVIPFLEKGVWSSLWTMPHVDKVPAAKKHTKHLEMFCSLVSFHFA